MTDRPTKQPTDKQTAIEVTLPVSNWLSKCSSSLIPCKPSFRLMVFMDTMGVRYRTISTYYVQGVPQSSAIHPSRFMIAALDLQGCPGIQSPLYGLATTYSSRVLARECVAKYWKFSGKKHFCRTPFIYRRIRKNCAFSQFTATPSKISTQCECTVTPIGW